MKPKSADDIRAFWQDAAQSETDDQGLRPTARDPYLQLAVEDIIESYLDAGQSVLDVGCGDGHSTLRFAARTKQITGVDYIEGFVERARQNAAAQGVKNALFEQGDVTDLETIRGRHGIFDAVISIRCLINLPTVAMQDAALVEIARSIRPGGLFLCSEGWLEGWEGLNRLRALSGLERMQLVRYNRLIERARFETTASRFFERIAYGGVGLYLFVSRVLQPCLVRPDSPQHTHPLNKVGHELQASLGLGERFDEFDYAGVLIFRRLDSGGNAPRPV